MSEELRELRLNKKLPAREMVSVVKEIYPKYDKTMQSKCERGSEYGIRIRQDALEALYTKFDPEKLQKIRRKSRMGISSNAESLAGYQMKCMQSYRNISRKMDLRPCRTGSPLPLRNIFSGNKELRKGMQNNEPL